MHSTKIPWGYLFFGSITLWLIVENKMKKMLGECKKDTVTELNAIYKRHQNKI